jgi:hypothetical protein
MALSVESSGSQTATISTEHTLATITAANVFNLALDVANMTGGTSFDILIVREYGKARSSDSERLLGEYTLAGVQGQALFETVPRVSPHYLKYTIQQTQGTGRAFPWAVYQAQ